MLNLRKVGDNSHVPAVWFAAEPEDKRSNIRFVFYQEGIDMADPFGFLKYKRKDNPYRPVSERILDFEELQTPLSREERQEQAARCMNCGIPWSDGINDALKQLGQLALAQKS